MNEEDRAKYLIRDTLGYEFDALLDPIHRVFQLEGSASVANDNADRVATRKIVYSTKPYPDMNAVSSDEKIIPEIPKKRYLSIVQWHRRLGQSWPLALE
jgi:hypothetical protein